MKNIDKKNNNKNQFKYVKDVKSPKYNNVEKKTLDCEVELLSGEKLPYTLLCDENSMDEVAKEIWQKIQENKEKGVEVVEYVETDEIKARKKAEKALFLRAERNRKLAATDYMVLTDSPFTTEQKRKIKEYRQSLRDITEQETFPDEVVWPELNLKKKQENTPAPEPTPEPETTSELTPETPQEIETENIETQETENTEQEK